MAINSIPSALTSYYRSNAVESVRSARPASMPVLHLPTGTVSNVSDPTRLSLTDSASVVNKAGLAVSKVRDGLAELAKLAQAAKFTGGIETVDDVTLGAIQTDMNSIIKGMDKAIEAASVSGANLVSSSSRDVRLQTTGLGGSIVAAVQALDSKALGIADIDLFTDAGIDAAIAAITLAQGDLGAKDVRIQALSSAYQGQTDFNTIMQGLIASTTAGFVAGYGVDARTQTAAASRGSTVNVWA